MNYGIGLRTKPNQVVFAIIGENETDIEIRLVDKINVPLTFEVPEKLKFIRNTMLDILAENKVKFACIRVTESTAQTLSVERISIEAILQELIASSSVEKYCVGQISNMSALLSIERTQYKEIVDKNAPHILGTEVWNSFTKDEKEAILAALCALKLSL